MSNIELDGLDPILATNAFKNLTEVDKLLRSSELRQQYEIIYLFPNLLNTYPIPIIISSGFLKLADFFKDG